MKYNKILFLACLSSYNFIFQKPKYINFGAARLYSYLKQQDIDITFQYMQEYVDIDYGMYDLVMLSMPGFEMITNMVFRKYMQSLADSSYKGEIIVGGMLTNRIQDVLGQCFNRFNIGNVKYFYGEGEDDLYNYIVNSTPIDYSKIHTMRTFHDTIIEPEAILENTAPVEVNSRCTWNKCTFCVFRDSDAKYASKIPKEGNGKRIANKILEYVSRGIDAFYMVGVEITEEHIKDFYLELLPYLDREIEIYYYNTKIVSINKFIDALSCHPFIKTKLIGYAAETFDLKIMSQIKKNVDIRPDNIIKLADYCNENDIAIKINIMLGLTPNDKELIMTRYMDFIRLFNQVDVTFNCFFDYRKKLSMVTRDEAQQFVRELVEMQKVDNKSARISFQVHWGYEVLMNGSYSAKQGGKDEVK